MNERWGVDPQAGEDERDWRFVMSKFGPYTGRYIIQYPASWVQIVKSYADTLPDPRGASLKRIIDIAIQEKKILRLPGTKKLKEGKSWLSSIQEDREIFHSIKDLILRRGTDSGYVDIDNFNPPAVVSKKKNGLNAIDFLEECEALILLSPSLYFTDPYFNPTNPQHYKIMNSLLNSALKGRCESVDIWILESKIRFSATDEELAQWIRMRENKTNSNPGTIRLHLVDNDLKDFHDRYIFNEYGGISFTRGFQAQQIMNVWVMPEDMHKSYIEVFPRGLCQPHIVRTIDTKSIN